MPPSAPVKRGRSVVNRGCCILSLVATFPVALLGKPSGWARIEMSLFCSAVNGLDQRSTCLPGCRSDACGPLHPPSTPLAQLPRHLLHFKPVQRGTCFYRTQPWYTSLEAGARPRSVLSSEERHFGKAIFRRHRKKPSPALRRAITEGFKVRCKKLLWASGRGQEIAGVELAHKRN